MKIIIFAILFFCSTISMQAQASIEKITLNGTVYTVTRQIPVELADIFGRYDYEWGKEKTNPIVQLNKDGTGLFQPHGVEPVPIEFWFDCDEKGVIRKQEGINGRFQVTLLIKNGPNSIRNRPPGSYDLMGLIVVPDRGSRLTALPIELSL